MKLLVTTTASSLIIRSTPGGADTGLRLKQGERAEALGATYDLDWKFIVAAGRFGWVSSKYLSDVPAEALEPHRLYSLEGEDPELTAKIAKLAELAGHEGIEFDTADFGGVRTQADTVKIMKYRDDDYALYVRNLKAKNPSATPTPINTWRKIAPWGRSFHNYGCARDLKVTKRPPSFPSSSAAMARLRVLARQVGLRTIQDDDPHVELPITLAQAKSRWLARTGGQ